MSMFIVKYIKDVFSGVKSLLTGMKLTGWYALHHGKEKITQQYPDNKDTWYCLNDFGVKW